MQIADGQKGFRRVRQQVRLEIQFAEVTVRKKRYGTLPSPGELQADVQPVIAIVHPPQGRVDMIFRNENAQSLRADRPLDCSAPRGLVRLHLNQFREERQVGLSQGKHRRQIGAEVLELRRDVRSRPLPHFPQGQFRVARLGFQLPLPRKRGQRRFVLPIVLVTSPRRDARRVSLDCDAALPR